MSKFRLLTVLILTGILVSACGVAQSVRHGYLMRGQVVEVADGQAVICVGKRDGANVGQELETYKLVPSDVQPVHQTVSWQRVPVGTVRIVQVLDEHFAKAQVVTGNVAVNNIVELQVRY